MKRKSNKNTSSIDKELKAEKHRSPTREEIEYKEKWRDNLILSGIFLAIIIIVLFGYLYYIDMKKETEFKKDLKDYCIEHCYEIENDFDICKWRCRNADK